MGSGGVCKKKQKCKSVETGEAQDRREKLRETKRGCGAKKEK